MNSSTNENKIINTISFSNFDPQKLNIRDNDVKASNDGYETYENSFINNKFESKNM